MENVNLTIYRIDCHCEVLHFVDDHVHCLGVIMSHMFNARRWKNWLKRVISNLSVSQTSTQSRSPGFRRSPRFRSLTFRSSVTPISLSGSFNSSAKNKESRWPPTALLDRQAVPNSSCERVDFFIDLNRINASGSTKINQTVVTCTTT